MESKWRLLVCVFFCVTGVSLALYFIISGLTHSKEKIKPHIILILGDDIGFNDVSFRGSNQIPTPNIDALGYNGIIFNNLYSQASCTPSRTALLSGQYPLRVGTQGDPFLNGQNVSLPLNITLLPEYLNKLGYESHAVGKWHLGFETPRHLPTGRGFKTHFGYWHGLTHYFNYTCPYQNNIVGFDLHDPLQPAWKYQNKYATDVFTKRALKIIERHPDDKTKPLFLYIGHLAAHSHEDTDILGVPDIKSVNARYGYIQNPVRRRLAEVMNVLDHSIGLVVKKLEEKKMLQNSIIIFLSDNGAPSSGASYNGGSNYPLRGIKISHFEGAIKSTGVLYSPLLKKKGYVNRGLMHFVDFVPTLYNLAGGDIKNLGNLDGIDQWEMLSEDKPSKRQNLIVDMDESNNIYSIISEEDDTTYKLIIGTFNRTCCGENWTAHFPDPSHDEKTPLYNITSIFKSLTNIAISQINDSALTETTVHTLQKESTFTCELPTQPTPITCTKPYCLFDLKNDPCEVKNIIKDQRNIAHKLKAKLDEYWKVLMPQVSRNDTDPLMNPVLYNGTYCTFLENSWCTRTNKIWKI